MSEQAEHNGHAPRVSFGTKEWQSMQPSVGLSVVELWHHHVPSAVGRALTEPDVFNLLLPLLTPEILSLMLTRWRDKTPSAFGGYLAEVLTGAKPKAARGE